MPVGSLVRVLCGGWLCVGLWPQVLDAQVARAPEFPSFQVSAAGTPIDTSSRRVSIVWSSCDFRGEGMLAGAAAGLVIGLIDHPTPKDVALRTGFGMAAGWLVGRTTRKSGCSAPATRAAGSALPRTERR